MLAFLNKARFSKINWWVFNALLLVYFLIGLLVISFDLGSESWCRDLSDSVSHFIPSINDTARITTAQKSVSVVLSIAWLWGVVIYLPMIWSFVSTSFQSVNWNHWKGLSLVYRVGSIIFPLAILYVEMREAPTDTGGFNGIIFNRLAASPLYAVTYGAGIMLIIWFLLVMLTIFLAGLISNFNKSNGE